MRKTWPRKEEAKKEPEAVIMDEQTEAGKEIYEAAMEEGGKIVTEILEGSREF